MCAIMTQGNCVAIQEIASLTCQVCFDTWSNPVQLLPCRHTFCAKCVPPSVLDCPLCKSLVQQRGLPEEGIMNASELVRVRCGGCGWEGTRKASFAHHCGVNDTHSKLESYPEQTDEEILLALRGAAVGGNGVRNAAPSRRVFPTSQNNYPPEVRQGIPLS